MCQVRTLFPLVWGVIMIIDDNDMPIKLQEVLKQLEQEVPEIEATAVVSSVGFPIASALPRNVDETRVAAITAAMLTMGERAAMEFSKGNLNRVIVHGSDGIILSMAAGSEAVLTVSATHSVRLGMLLLYCGRAADKIKNLLELQ